MIIYDEIVMHVFLACEGIVYGEHMDVYQFICSILSKSAPGWPLSEVEIVSGDGVFDYGMIISLGFINALLFLINSICWIPGYHFFGKSGYELLRGRLVKMVQASSENESEEMLRAAQKLLQARKKKYSTGE